MKKHIFYSISFVLFTLCFLAYSIFAAATRRYDWLYISVPLIIVYSLCFLVEIMKIKEVMIMVTNDKNKEGSLETRILRQKQDEKARLELEIIEDREIISELEQKVEELSEGVGVDASEQDIKNSE